MEAKIIKETVSSERRKEIYELGKNNKFSDLTIYILKPEKDTLSIHGNVDISRYINLDKVPSTFDILRVDSSVNSGVVFTDKNSVLVRIFGQPKDVLSSKKKFKDAIIESFAKYNVHVSLSSHRPESNDFVFIKDGKEKKFCGCVTDLEQMYFSFFITLEFDASKVEGIFKLNTSKFKERGVVSDISDVVGGVHEVNPEINDTVVDQIIEKILS